MHSGDYFMAAFDGIKKAFNILRGAAIDSSKKVEEGVHRIGRGIQKLVSRISVQRKNIPKPGVKKPGLKGFKTQFMAQKAPPRVIERMKMDKDEIQMFKELIDKKYEKKEEKEDKDRKEVYQRAALEEILKEEEKPGLDPKMILVMGAISFVVILVLMVVLGFGIEIGLVFGMLIFFMSAIIVFMPRIRSGKRTSEASRELPFALRQMATELQAGLGLHESMRSVALSGYGSLSEEFARTLEEIK